MDNSREFETLTHISVHEPCLQDPPTPGAKIVWGQADGSAPRPVGWLLPAVDPSTLVTHR